MDEFDLVVIGGGAAGEKGAAQAAWFKKSVALVEREPFHGGAMVNTGTLPSKTLRETALYLSGFRQRGLFGVDLTLKREITVQDLLRHLDEVLRFERERIRENLQRHGVRQYFGAARFVDPHTLELASKDGPTRLRAKHVLIATGSSPNRPASFPFEHPRVYDSDELVRVNELPKRMVVVGGGVIGCEYACLFATLGTKVTIVEARGSIMGFLDGELIARLTADMKALGIDFHVNAQVKSCDASDAMVRVVLDSGASLDAEAVLVCAGRQGNTQSLALENAGLVAGKRGHLEVDARFRTAVPHIAAAGDVIGNPALASVSMEQARVAVVHLFDLGYKMNVAPIFPTGIFTIPEVSMAGETEESLKKAGVEYVKGVALFDHNARGVIIGSKGVLKLLFRKADLKLLGVHILGESAIELVHQGLSALMHGATADHFIELCFNYPSLSEAYKYATYDAMGKKALDE